MKTTLKYLRGILEEPRPRKTATRLPGNRDYYAACMNETAIDKLGARPVQPELEADRQPEERKGSCADCAMLHLEGDSLLFGAGSMQDPDNSEDVIVGVDQGGLGLPTATTTQGDAKRKKSASTICSTCRRSSS